MKKLILIISLLIFIPVLKADGVEDPVTFTLLDNFYSEVTKTYENNTTVFNYKNKLLNMDLSNIQLKNILSQKPGSGSSKLVYYETLNIKVNPVVDTPFESLENKSIFYRANGGGSWPTSVNHNDEMEATASQFPLNNIFWPWGFRILYRENETDSYKSTIPSGVNLNDKTLEEQLATLLGIDLSTTPNGVINEYKRLWKFSLLNNRIYLIRFDFLDTLSTPPILKEGTTNEYLTSSLKKLGTHFVAIKYTSEEETPTFKELENESNKKSWILPSVVTTIVSSSIAFFFMKKYNLIK